jgi:hypothetical protein
MVVIICPPVRIGFTYLPKNCGYVSPIQYPSYVATALNVSTGLLLNCRNALSLVVLSYDHTTVQRKKTRCPKLNLSLNARFFYLPTYVFISQAKK